MFDLFVEQLHVQNVVDKHLNLLATSPRIVALLNIFIPLRLAIVVNQPQLLVTRHHVLRVSRLHLDYRELVNCCDN